MFQSNAEIKKHMKKVMPFVQLIKESYAQNGANALNLTSEFDASTIIRENLDYVKSTLEVRFWNINYCNEKLFKPA